MKDENGVHQEGKDIVLSLRHLSSLVRMLYFDEVPRKQFFPRSKGSTNAVKEATRHPSLSTSQFHLTVIHPTEHTESAFQCGEGFAEFVEV